MAGGVGGERRLFAFLKSATKGRGVKRGGRDPPDSTEKRPERLEQTIHFTPREVGYDREGVCLRDSRGERASFMLRFSYFIGVCLLFASCSKPGATPISRDLRAL
jgi:hypothetical protein